MDQGDKVYTQLGGWLISLGAGLSLVSLLLLHSTPLSALGIATLVVGAVSFALGRTRPRMSLDVSASLLQAGLENIAALVEELGLKSKAIYLPSSLTGGKSQALIPLHINSSPPHIVAPLPRRLIVKYGSRPEEVGLLVSTPGSAIVEMLKTSPASMESLETALSTLLEGRVELGERIKVTMENSRVNVEVSHPRIEYKRAQFYECLGSPVASIIAAIAAETWQKPVTIYQEEQKRGRSHIELEALG